MATLDPWDMSDEALEEAFRNAKADGASPITDIEDNYEEEEEVKLEHPTEDSDDNDGTEIVELDDGIDEPAELDAPDGDVDEEVEPTEDPVEDKIDEVQEVQKYKFKANGKEYEMTDDEMKSQFPKIFGQAMDYTKKTQAMKPWRQTIDAIESAKLSHEDVSLMIDVLRGDKQAIAEVIKRTGTDALDIDTENSKYTPKSYGRDETALAIKDVIDEISADKEYDITHKILSKEWDDKSFAEFTKDPELIRQLHVDVKSGMYNQVQPIAEKLKVFDRGRKTDLDYYLQAAGELFTEQDAEKQRQAAIENQRVQVAAKADRQAEIERVKATQQAREKTTEKVDARKAAAPVKAVSGTKKVMDYLDDSDEAFEEWYKKMDSSR